MKTKDKQWTRKKEANIRLREENYAQKKIVSKEKVLKK